MLSLYCVSLFVVLYESGAVSHCRARYTAAYIWSLGENSKQAEQQKDGADGVEINETRNNRVIYHTKNKREISVTDILFSLNLSFFF